MCFLHNIFIISVNFHKNLEQRNLIHYVTLKHFCATELPSIILLIQVKN